MMPGRRLSLVLWLVLLIACIAVIAQTRFRTDMGAFLPQSASLSQQVLTGQATSGAASHLLLADIDSASPAVLAALSEALATRLRAQPEFINVMNGDDKSFADVQNFVWRNRYLLGTDVTSKSFTVPGLRGALVNDLGLLGSDFGPAIQQSMSSDPTGEALTLQAQLGEAGGPASLDGVWFSANARRALLLVHTRAAGFDIGAQQQAVTQIQAAFARARSAIPGAAKARLRLSGPGIFAIHTQDMTKRDVMRLSILASLGAIGLLAFAYRSWRVMLLGILPVASGALAATATVSLAFGFVHGVTLGFGVTLIGESLDYAIYLFTQTMPGASPRDTLARIWPTLRLGMLTSVIGFSAMLFSSFTGFRQLGLFSIAGLVAASGVTRFVLPHLVPAGFFAPGADIISRPLRGIVRHRRILRWLVAACVLAGGIALISHRGGLWDNNISDLSPIPQADQALDQTLRQDMGLRGVRFFVVFKAATRQQALLMSETLTPRLNKLVAQQQIGGFSLPSEILPSDITQQQRQAAIPDAATLRANFARALVGLPFRGAFFTPFLQDAAAAKAAPFITAASLPPVLELQLSTMLARHGNGWVVMAPLHDVKNPAAMAAALPPGMAFVDLNQESDRLLHTFQREATLLAVIGSLAILVLLLLGLRSGARVIAVASPLAASVIVTAAILIWGSGKLSIFMVVGFLLIVAVGSNYCLFFERAEQDAEIWRRSVASIVLANLCTVCAYGLMAISGIPVLHDIGETVAIGTFLSLVCAAIMNNPRYGNAA